MEETIAVFIPIIFIIVTGLVVVTHFYLKSKEKQLMIEKGLSTEQMIELLAAREKDKHQNFILLKSGVIIIFLVIGGIIGSLIDRAYFFQWRTFEDGTRYYADDPVYGVWLAFLGLGIGAVVAHFIANKKEKEENK